MADDASLRGWEPALGCELTLPDVVEHAFDYRGDVTVDRVDGTRVVGYLYNRDASAREPFVQLFQFALDFLAGFFRRVPFSF